MNNQTQRDDTASNNATTIKATGMNNATSTANTGATIAGEGARQAAGFAHDDTQVENVEPVDGKLMAVTKTGKGIAVRDSSGSLVQTDQALTAAQQRVLNVYKSQHIVRDEDGATVFDAYRQPQVDWDGVVKSMRAGGQGRLADIVSGTPTQPAPTLTLSPGSGLDEDVGATSLPVTGGGLANPAPKPAPAVAPSVQPPLGAVALLKTNPGMRDAFDQKYGQGAAACVLGH
jgi:hypothetical protein